MGKHNIKRCVIAMGLALLLTGTSVVADQTISPAVFNALTSAQQAQEKGQLAVAQRVLEKTLKQVKEQPLELALVQQRLGYLAIAAQDNPSAIRWLNKALAHGELDDKAARQDRLNLAQLFAAEGQYAKAARLLERERKQGGLSPVQTQLLVQSYSQAGNYAKAIPLAEQVIRANSAVDDVWYELLVSMHFQQGNYAAAVRWQKMLLNRYPQSAKQWRQLASLQSQAGQQRAAAATLRLAHVGGFGLNVNDLDNLVALQVNAGVPWQAAHLLEELIAQQLVPDNTARQEQLAQLWTQARDRNRARTAWDALARDTGRSEHWLRLAGLQLEEGDWSDLLTTLKHAQRGASAHQRQLIRQWENYARSALEDNS